MMLHRTLSLLVSLSASLLLAGCGSEQITFCDSDRQGEQTRACFSRQCADGECDPGPVLAGGEFAVEAKSGGSELEGVDYEGVSFVTAAGGAEVLESKTDCLCDLSSDTCPEETTDLVCTWTGRFRAPAAGDLRIELRTPDGSGHDEYDVRAIEASAVRVSVLKAERNDLTVSFGSEQTLAPDAEGVVEVNAGDTFLYLIPAGLDAEGDALLTLGGAFAYTFAKDGILADRNRSGPGESFEALKAGETTVTVSALVGPAKATVRIRVR